LHLFWIHTQILLLSIVLHPQLTDFPPSQSLFKDKLSTAFYEHLKLYKEAKTDCGKNQLIRNKVTPSRLLSWLPTAHTKARS